MKVKLVVSKERYDEIKTMLAERGIDVDDNSDLVLSESNRFTDNLIVKDMVSNERVVLPIEDITYIETFGHSVEVHTITKTYQALDRLYKIVNLLDPDKFLRISNSAVIAKDKASSLNCSSMECIVFTPHRFFNIPR